MELPVKFIQSFGIIKGIGLYLKYKFHFTRKFHVPGILHPVYLRPGTIDEYTFIEMFIMKDYDIEYLIDNASQPVIIDAGANIGLSSVYFANRFPHAIIESYEPEEENFALLLKNTEKYPNIRPHKSAIWAKSGFVNLIDKGFGLRGFVTEEIGNECLTPATSMDDIILRNNYGHIDILKMDIEGSEKDLFDSNSAVWLPRVKYLIIELHDSVRTGASMSLFKALGPYTFSSSISGENLVIQFHPGEDKS